MKEEKGKQMSQIISKCWADEGFKKKLLADPAATLKAEGVELVHGLTIKALENTAKIYHLVIPVPPTALSDEQLDSVAGGLLAKAGRSPMDCFSCESGIKGQTGYPL